jgi:hypothetical protein
MLAVLSTLAFLATLWLVTMIALRMAEESGGKILAALKGQSPLSITVQQAQVPVRARYRSSTQARPVRVRARLNAAA